MKNRYTEEFRSYEKTYLARKKRVKKMFSGLEKNASYDIQDKFDYIMTAKAGEDSRHIPRPTEETSLMEDE